LLALWLETDRRSFDMQVAQKVRRLLESLALKDLTVVVVSDGDWNIVARVVSSDFESLPTEDRQDRVWACLRENLSEEELTRVDFVFTNTPSEQADAEARP
jgi:acid stress-induced BolA-like protein IbaG/YrbA